MQEMVESVKDQIGSICHPETGEFPTIVVTGDSLENLSCTVEGSPELLALIERRLGDDEEIKLVQKVAPDLQPPRAFLSHAWEDRKLAKRITTILHSNGIDTWWAEWCIRSGDSLRQKIDEGLGNCTHFIVLLTPKSLTKPWVNQEMDAGLVLKIRNQCSFIPLRDGLPPDKLPPLLSGMLSPDLSDFERGMNQLINDIYGVAKRPPLGPPPEVVTQSAETETGYSAAASTVAKLFVLTTKNAIIGDPQLRMSQIAEATSLTQQDVEDTLYELSGFVEVSHDRVLVKDELFATFDRYWMPWNPAEDALKIAADMVNDENFRESVRKIADRYGWTPRRINPAVAYLVNRDIVIGSKVLGSAPWVEKWISPRGGATHRFVRSRSL